MRYGVLIVDDEPDVHSITKLSLKSFRQDGRPLSFVSVHTGAEAVQAMRERDDIGLVLLDVVMETQTAGLDACRAIREQLGNRFVRIILRTGQPGVAPEKQVITDYDIDGYLAKTETSSVRLFTAVRTALKAYSELMALERHRAALAAIHGCMTSIHSYEPLEATLERLLAAARRVCPAPFAALWLEAITGDGSPQQYFVCEGDEASSSRAEQVRGAVTQHRASGRWPRGELVSVGEGSAVRIEVHRELGHGWLYLEQPQPDEVATVGLPLLAAHAESALYSSLAQRALEQRSAELDDDIPI